MKTSLQKILPLVFMAYSALSQPQAVATMEAPSEYSGVAADVDGTLFFAGNYYLYKTNPDDTGTRGVGDIIYQAVNLININGILYFTTYDNSMNEASLWRSDGTDNGTMPIKKFSSTFNHISPIVSIGNALYFGFQDKVYTSDGTQAGTVLVKDLNPSSELGFLRLSAFQNKLFISHRKADGHYDLWHSNGTGTGTAFIRSFNHIEFLKAAGNFVYFVADNGSGGNELWKTDINGAATIVKDLNPGSAGSFSADEVTVFAGVNDGIIFSTTAPRATWRSNGTAAGTVQLTSFKASEIVAAGSAGYFAHENQLWKTDGTPSGTAMLKIFPNAKSPATALTELTAYENTIFFAVDGEEIWHSNGAASGTMLIIDHVSPGENRTGSANLIRSGSLLYYFMTINYGESQAVTLYKYDPSQVWIPSLQLVDAGTEEDIRFLHNNDMLFTDQKISIRADASLTTGKVAFYMNGTLYRSESERPFALAGDNSGNYDEWVKSKGNYEIRVIPYSTSGAPGTPLTYNFTVADRQEACASGSIVREYWSKVTGSSVSAIPTVQAPSGTQTLTIFEGPVNQGTNYGARIKGFICAPSTGNYTFWISSNDDSELWFSTDDSPANKVKIASVKGGTASRQWDKYASQKSAAIALVAGQRYYIEALHKQGAGADNLAVGWQLPGGEMERPIPGSRLSPFTGNNFPEVIVSSPVDGETFTAPATVNINLKAVDRDGWVNTIEIFAGTKKINGYYTWWENFTWANVEAGSYPITVRVTDNDGATAISSTVNIIVNGPCTASGTIKREYWNGVAGSRVSDIPLSSPPSGAMELPAFEGPLNSGTNYGARVSGFICPPASGNYFFWIASNDQSELWFSNDDDPANKIKIASVTGATEPNQWNKYESQHSSAIALTAGKKYYIEALHKQGAGTGNLSVGWQLPDGTRERPIPGNRLSPYGENGEGDSRIIYPGNGVGDIDPLVVELQAEPVIGATRYTVELNTHPDFSGSSMTISSLEDYQNSFILKGLEHSTSYYTRVKSDISGYGPVSQFSTRDPIPQQRLWGLTTHGGANNLGTVFSFSIDSAHFVKHLDKQFVYVEGGEYDEQLWGSLIPGPEGIFYGHSEHDYGDNIFTLTKEGHVTWWQANSYFSDGSMMLASNNFIYATSNDDLGGGVIDKYDPERSYFDDRVRSFETREYGRDVGSRLLERNDGYLYGAGGNGGLNEGGVLYRIRHNGADFEVLHYFAYEVSGMNPYSGLTESDGFLYGTTQRGGSIEQTGTLFRIKPDGSGFTKLHDFDGINGRNPHGEVINVNEVLYGMTTKGGSRDLGIVYRMNTDGTGFKKLHDFTGPDGANPSGALVHDASGNLYGMTSNGGSDNSGVIFKIANTGTGFTKLFDLSATAGAHPNGSLVIREDTFSPPAAVVSAFRPEADLGVTIHPNPSTDHFTIQVKSNAGEAIRIMVTDPYGQPVTTYEIEPDTPIQIGGELKRGIYIMKIMQGKQVVLQRMVKK